MNILDMLQMLFPLFLITALLGAAWYFVNKKKIIHNFTKYSPVNIDVVSVKPIMPKKYIAAVRVEEKLLILGISDNSINLLLEKEFDESSLNLNLNDNLNGKFQDILKTIWPGR